MSEELVVTVENGVGTLRFNRPDSMNALSPYIFKTAVETLEAWAIDESVKCIVVTGTGRAFCAGGDVKAMNSGQNVGGMTTEQKLTRQRGLHKFSGLLYSIPKVTIAAVNGVAAGAGFAISLACDLRIASDKARFTTAFSKVGFSGDLGITWPLTRILSEGKAKEFLLLSEMISVDEAYRLGLVNKVVPDDEFQGAVDELAARFAEGPQISYRLIKENVSKASTHDYAELLEREVFTQVYCMETDDHKEGARAFVEKRKPVFKGH